MKIRSISVDDEIFRDAIYPFAYTNSPPDKARFRPDKVLKLRDETNADGGITLSSSLTMGALAPNQRELRCHGCRVARRMNEKDKQSDRYKEASRRIYCGSYHIPAGSIGDLATVMSEVTAARVIHEPEDGEVAHVALLADLSVTDSVLVEGAKTKIIHSLWQSSRGPLRHVCGDDADTVNHPSSRLEEPPAGAYAPTRSLFKWIAENLCFYMKMLFGRMKIAEA
jgi:hypothetical protein